MLLKLVYTDVRMIQLRNIVSLMYENYSLFSRILLDIKVHAQVWSLFPRSVASDSANFESIFAPR